MDAGDLNLFLSCSLSLPSFLCSPVFRLIVLILFFPVFCIVVLILFFPILSCSYSLLPVLPSCCCSSLQLSFLPLFLVFRLVVVLILFFPALLFLFFSPLVPLLLCLRYCSWFCCCCAFSPNAVLPRFIVFRFSCPR